MADEKEDIILNLEIDQTSLMRDLTESKKAITDLKNEQRKLNDEFKKGTKTVDEYAEESVQLENKLKKEQQTYNTLNKSINTVSNSLEAQRQRLIALKRERDKIDRSTAEGVKQFNALNKTILELNESIKKAEQSGGDFQRNVGDYAKGAKVAGFSIDDLAGKFSGLLNPITAVGAGVVGLISLYKQSAVGSQDFEFATNTLSNSLSIFSNQLGSLFNTGNASGRGGKGIFSRITSGLLEGILNAGTLGAGTVVARQAELAALQQERLKDLEVSLIRAQGFAKDAEKRAEDARRNRDDAEKSLQDRLKETQTIEDELNYAGQIRVTVLKSQLQAIQTISAILGNSELPEVQKEIANREREIKDIEEEINGKLTENKTARATILSQIKEQKDLEEFIRREANKPNNRSLTDRPDAAKIAEQGANLQLDVQRKLSDDLVKLQEQAYYDDLQNKRRNAELKKQIDLDYLAATADAIALGAQLFEDQSEEGKILGAINAGVKAYEAANNALATGGPYPLNLINAALTLAVGLENASKIAGFSEGGYTGSGGNSDFAGFVHKNEVVWNASDVAAVGGPGVANAMRPTHKYRNAIGRGYQDGGIVTDNAVRETNQTVAQMNLIKNMPAPEVSVKEITKVTNRVTVKENIAKR